MKSIYAGHYQDIGHLAPVDHGFDAYQAVNWLTDAIHRNNVIAGWWTDMNTMGPLNRNVGELLMLAVSELAEAMEGDRKDKMDDHLPHRTMFEVELADCVIRICDMAGAAGIPLGTVIAEKLVYNAKRADHKLENRAKADGKKY